MPRDERRVADSYALCSLRFALLFSRCPPCRAFTPTLIAAYNAAKKEGLPFELVFVSSDEDSEGFAEYTKDMPWPSIDFEKEDVRAKLGEQFGVKGIPSLQIIGKNGKIITTDGRSGITKSKEAAIKEWTSHA